MSYFLWQQFVILLDILYETLFLNQQIQIWASCQCAWSYRISL